MMIAVGRIRGKAAAAGIGRASLAGLAAAAAGTAVGVAAALVMPAGGKLYDGAAGAAAVISAVLVFGVVAYAAGQGRPADGDDAAHGCAWCNGCGGEPSRMRYGC